MTTNDLDARVLAASSTARDVVCPYCRARPGDYCSGTVRNGHGERIAAWSRAKARAKGRQRLRELSAPAAPPDLAALHAAWMARPADQRAVAVRDLERERNEYTAKGAGYAATLDAAIALLRAGA